MRRRGQTAAARRARSRQRRGQVDGAAKLDTAVAVANDHIFDLRLHPGRLAAGRSRLGGWVFGAWALGVRLARHVRRRGRLFVRAGFRPGHGQGLFTPDRAEIENEEDQEQQTDPNAGGAGRRIDRTKSVLSGMASLSARQSICLPRALTVSIATAGRASRLNLFRRPRQATTLVGRLWRARPEFAHAPLSSQSNGLDPPVADTSPRDEPLPLPQRPAAGRPSLPGLMALFGLFYFFQGIGEPDDGLIAQPVRSLLIRWGQNAGQVASFSAMLMLPWSIKPLYGLITDFVPLLGYRRKSYLILTSGLSAAALFALRAIPLTPANVTLMLGLLMVPAVGIAFSDVVIDALMIERGQPHGWTGQLQGMQWTGMYAAMARDRCVGGLFEPVPDRVPRLLLLRLRLPGRTGLACLAPERRSDVESWRSRPQPGALLDAVRIPVLWAAALFLFLWNFNPFSASILQIHMTGHIGFSQQFFGNLKTITALGLMAGALSYGLLRRYIAFRVLLHSAIVLGIVSTAAYWGLQSELSAKVVSASVGYTTAVATLIQLDLAAQVCPVAVAGTVFAMLMSLSNLSTLLSELLGGHLYDWLSDILGSQHAAFQWLVGIGSLTTAACWLVMPWLVRGLAATVTQTADSSAGAQ